MAPPPFARARRRATFRILVLVALAAVVGASSPPFTSGIPPHPSLVGCLNAADDDADNTTNPRLQGTVYRDFVEGRPARLRYWWGRWSAKGSGAKQQRLQQTVTLASSLTAGRLDQLEAQCRLWSGPISAVVYLAVRLHGDPKQQQPRLADLPPDAKAHLDAAAAAIALLHARAETDPEGCALDVLLLFETVADDLMPAVLPVNAMRNYALLQARTPLVVMADVDLLPSRSFSEWLVNGAKEEGGQSSSSSELQRMLEDQDALFVLPAFETPRQDADPPAAHAVAERAARSKTKAELEAMASKGEVFQFALRIFHEGHDDTGYAHWWRTAENTPLEKSHTVDKTTTKTIKDYEPWFVISRFRGPWYDGRFRGYGWNKVTMLAHLKALDFAFRVHPAGWLVHRQHERSAADKMYQSQKRAYEQAAEKAAEGGGKKDGAVFETVAGVTHRLRDEVVAALSAGGGGGGAAAAAAAAAVSYSPVLDDGLRACVAALPWWKRELFAGGSPRAVEEALGIGQEKEEGEEESVVLAFPPSALPRRPEDACIAAGEAGEAAVLARVLAEYGGALPAPGVGKTRRQRKRRRGA
jgi:glycosyltransferase-like protein LARGE